MDTSRGASGSNVGLNILASPSTRNNNEDDEFVSPSALADTENANDWDLSLFNSRPPHASVTRVASRWDRESLFQHFDPCARDRPFNPTPVKVCTVPSSSQHLRPTTALGEDKNNLRDDFFLTDQHDLGAVVVDSKEVFTFPPGDDVLVQLGSPGAVGELVSPPGEHNDWKIDNESPQLRRSGLIETDIEENSPTEFYTTVNSIVSPNEFYTTAREIVVAEDEEVEVVIRDDEAETHTRIQLDNTLLKIEEYKAASEADKRTIEEYRVAADEDKRSIAAYKAAADEDKRSIAEYKAAADEDKRSIAEYRVAADEDKRTIEELKAAMRTSDEEKRSMESQLDQLTRAFRSMQMAFHDVNGRYERVQQLLVNSQKNQDLLVARDTEMVGKFASVDAQFEEVKSTAKAKLDSMYQTYESKFQNLNAEAGRFRAQLRRAEMRNEGLENEVLQKTSEIKKLSALCDDLIRQNGKN